MMEKNIKEVLKKNINEWIESIECPTFKNLAAQHTIVTGGSIVSLVEGKKPNDIDVYFRNKETVLKAAEYFAGLWNKNHKGQKNKIDETCRVMVLDGANPSRELLDYFKIHSIEESKAIMVSSTTPDRVKLIFPSDGVVGGSVELVEDADETPVDKVNKDEKANPYDPKFITSNAVTLYKDIQTIIRFYGEPTEIHETFDFEHTRGWYDYREDTLTIPASVYECIINKRLNYTGSKYPVCSLFRIRKFINRGWHINAGQILKMAMQISELDLSDPAVLEDQLVGVDTLYFRELIDTYQEEKINNPELNLDAGYVMSLVDRIF